MAHRKNFSVRLKLNECIVFSPLSRSLSLSYSRLNFLGSEQFFFVPTDDGNVENENYARDFFWLLELLRQSTEEKRKWKKEKTFFWVEYEINWSSQKTHREYQKMIIKSQMSRNNKCVGCLWEFKERVKR